MHPDFREVATQLHRDFDLLTGAAVVDRVLDEVAGMFADARVRTFLPLLVHRCAKRDLRSLTDGAHTARPGAATAGDVTSQALSAG